MATVALAVWGAVSAFLKKALQEITLANGQKSLRLTSWALAAFRFICLPLNAIRHQGNARSMTYHSRAEQNEGGFHGTG
jgi:hypothetical protein